MHRHRKRFRPTGPPVNQGEQSVLSFTCWVQRADEIHVYMTESLGRCRQSLEWRFGMFVHLCFLTSFTRLCPSGNVLSDTLPPVGTLDEYHISLDSRVGNAMETVEHNALKCRRDKDASWRDTDVRPQLGLRPQHCMSANQTQLSQGTALENTSLR